MGFPLEMFPVLFAIPRTAGWLAHWQEMLDQDSKIARPRQLYIGPDDARLRADRRALNRDAPATPGSSPPGAADASGPPGPGDTHKLP